MIKTEVLLIFECWVKLAHYPLVAWLKIFLGYIFMQRQSDYALQEQAI